MVERRPLLVLAVLLGLTAAGCGDDDQNASEPPSSTASSSSSSSSTTTTAPVETTTTTAPGLSDESALRFDGIGPIKVGMTLAQATAAVGKPVTIDSGYTLDSCSFAQVTGGPVGLMFMVLRDKETDPWRIVRVDVTDESRIATLSGVRVGATEAEVKQTYSGPGKTGTIEVQPHEYVEGGHYITYDVDGPAGHRLLFETDGAKVTQFRSGRQDPVGYVEGCA